MAVYSLSKRLSFALACTLMLVGCATTGVAPGRRTPPAVTDIPWASDRALSWGDFQGRVDPAAPRERVALSATTLHYRYEYSLERDGEGCRYWIKNVNAQAVFNPADSWVKPGHETASVLQHEQGHFDLTQVFKRRLDARTAELVGPSSTCTGASLAEAQSSAERGAADRIQRLFDDVWQQHADMQWRYDAGTQHGMLREAQETWSAAIARGLRTGEWRTPG